MSKNSYAPSRRSVLKKTGAAASLAVGTVGSAAAQVGTQEHEYDHWIEFKTSSGVSQSYSASVPDSDPQGENLEKEDTVVERGSDYTIFEGEVKCTFEPCYDVYHFNGSLDDSDFWWTVASEITVTVDGEVVN